MTKIIQENPESFTNEGLARIIPNAKIRVQARKFHLDEQGEILEDIDGQRLLSTWWVETEILEYEPAFDNEDRLKARDYALIRRHPDLISTWYKPTGANRELTYARSSGDIHPEDYTQLKELCDKLFFHKVRRFFILTQNGLKFR